MPLLLWYLAVQCFLGPGWRTWFCNLVILFWVPKSSNTGGLYPKGPLATSELWICRVWWKQGSARRHTCLWTVSHFSLLFIFASYPLSFRDHQIHSQPPLSFESSQSKRIVISFSKRSNHQLTPESFQERKYWDLVLCSSDARENLERTGNSRTNMVKLSPL